MKKRIFALVVCVCALAVFACAFSPASANTKAVAAKPENGVLKARFQNMLNRNFVYNADFENADVVTENAILALLDKRDAENPDYISTAVVTDFVKDMYGIEIVDVRQDESVYKEGYIYIMPRGFTAYENKVENIAANEDGSFTVTSSVTVFPHDGEQFITKGETLFVPNAESAFGYSIIYSNLKGVASGI
ncbi:MAG: hypothetical protein IK086_00775 [Clostridia bacterium]|nr:hypothetical protein [Clostridia bacterium]